MNTDRPPATPPEPECAKLREENERLRAELAYLQQKAHFDAEWAKYKAGERETIPPRPIPPHIPGPAHG